MKHLKLKSELKVLAKEIREKKDKRKGSKYGYVEGLNPARWTARHKHIAYCLLRGRTYEQIEQPRYDNKPNMRLVEQYVAEYAEEVKDEALCASG